MGFIGRSTSKFALPLFAIYPQEKTEVEGGQEGEESRTPLWAKPGPDADGGWEECKESEPPMGRAVPPCKVCEV